MSAKRSWRPARSSALTIGAGVSGVVQSYLRLFSESWHRAHVRGDCCLVPHEFPAFLFLLRPPRALLKDRRRHRSLFDGALASAAVVSGVMDPTASHDPAMEGTAESAQQEQEPAGPRSRLPTRPSASEPFRRFERGLSLPLLGVPQPTSPEYSWAPARVASNRLAGQPDPGRGRSLRLRCSDLLAAVLLSGAILLVTERAPSDLPRAISPPSTTLLSIIQMGAGVKIGIHRERDPPRDALRGNLRRGGGGDLLGAAGILLAASRSCHVRSRLDLGVVAVGGMAPGAAVTAAVRTPLSNTQ
ncbi:unnamed protein product [Closterium sp. Naga37s-1]|nr:unnamed protein product [Closterium sp. Naga37s-1]